MVHRGPAKDSWESVPVLEAQDLGGASKASPSRLHPPLGSSESAHQLWKKQHCKWGVFLDQNPYLLNESKFLPVAFKPLSAGAPTALSSSFSCAAQASFQMLKPPSQRSPTQELYSLEQTRVGTRHRACKHIMTSRISALEQA